ncbi:MAG: D-glycerate 2-kinase [Syntrophus sp. SKADARSKE-3]|nr:D-glycerate 2-kinase [Syntrophus sp. SKADARSKE-3]
MNQIDHHQIAAQIFGAVLQGADPYVLVESHMDRIFSTWQAGDYRKLLLISFGKAASPMARAVSDKAGAILTWGIVITKYGHLQAVGLPARINCFEAAHPVPDEAGVKATYQVIETLEAADEQTLVICLISGGGSALLVAPHEGITLAEKQQVTQLLLKAGADIQELNAVRKHISRIKGGRLAEAAYPARVLSLILSDVIGDPLDVIASGPTSPDRTTFADALGVVRRYGLTDKIPGRALDIMIRGDRGEIPDTPKEGNPVFRKVENLIIGSNRKAIEMAEAKALALGYPAVVLSAEQKGEARDVGTALAREAIRRQRLNCETDNGKLCLLAGGETTVTVKGAGLGGRNMELALAFAIELKGTPGITLLSAGTDGTDGPTDAAGAIVDGETLAKAMEKGLDPEDYLNRNDSYSFFKATECLLTTGPTGTNVMDIQIILIG